MLETRNFNEQEFIDNLMNFCRADEIFLDEIKNLYYGSAYYLYSLTNKCLEGSSLEGDLFALDKPYSVFADYEMELAKLYIKTMVCDMFNNKNLSQEKASKKNYIYDSILNQLRYSD